VKLTVDNTAIVLDSTADFPDAQARFPNFRIVPLYVRFGEVSFRDYVDITPDEFYARLSTVAELPTTSQPTPADFLAVYEELAPHYEHILSVQISSTLSGTFASAEAAAELLGGEKVRVIDSRTVAASLALVAIGIQQLLERGTTNEEIDAFIARYRAGHRLLFTVNTLEYLAKGGRIGRAAAFAGNLLNVKPILTIRDGEVVPLKRVRGNRKAFQEFVDALDTRTSDVPTLHIGIAHADAPERMAELEKMVRDRRPQAQIEAETSLGAVVGTHSGPGCVGFFWFDDVDG
jgi:DegV family protein with EDD domain